MIQEVKLIPRQAEQLLDHLNDIVNLTQALETANLGSAIWVREANSALKSVAACAQPGRANASLAGGAGQLFASAQPALSSDNMLLQRASYDVTSAADRLRETLRQAAFRAVFEGEVPKELKDRLMTQARALQRAFLDLHARYMAAQPAVRPSEEDNG